MPSIPGIFSGGKFAIVDATGSITISATELVLGGDVSILGGLLGQGHATLDLNWTTGVYSVTGGFSMYAGIISFNGSLTFTNQGDITLLATASVNVPGIIPFIGGQSLGNLNFYLQYRPTGDLTQSYVSVWTTVNLFVTSFTFGFKIDFTGSVNLLDGNDIAAISAPAATTQAPPMQPPKYTYSHDYTIPDPGASSAQVTLSSLSFFDYLYSNSSGNETVSGARVSTEGATAHTNYQLSKANVILPSLEFDVLNTTGGGSNSLGHVTFDKTGKAQFGTIGNSAFRLTSVAVTPNGLVTLFWNGTVPQTSLAASYLVSDAYVAVLQKTNHGPVEVARYTIDPLASPSTGGLTPTSPGGALYMDQVTSTTPVQGHAAWTSTYTLPHGDPDRLSLSFTIKVGTTNVGTGSFDAGGAFHFVPNGTPALVPQSALQQDNLIKLDWAVNPGTTSITAMYHSRIDRVLNIDFTRDVAPGGLPGQYTVQVVTSSPLGSSPMFTETTHYLPPVVSFAQGPPSINRNGTFTGTIFANSFPPNAGQGGTKVSLYYTTTRATTGGTLFQTLDYGTFVDNNGNFVSSSPTQAPGLKYHGFQLPGFQNLPAGQYYFYAAIDDGQNPRQYSIPAGPVITTGPKPVLTGPAFLALTPGASTSEQGTFSAAAGTALGVNMTFTTPVTIDFKVEGGGHLVLPAGSIATQFPFTYPSAAAATTDLNGLQFVADSTLANSATVTLTAATTINGTMYQSVALDRQRLHRPPPSTRAGSRPGFLGRLPAAVVKWRRRRAVTDTAKSWRRKVRFVAAAQGFFGTIGEARGPNSARTPNGPLLIMLLTDRERVFLAAFIYEATTDPFKGPATDELHRRNIYYTGAGGVGAGGVGNRFG